MTGMKKEDHALESQIFTKMKDLFVNWTHSFFDDSYWKNNATENDQKRFTAHANEFNAQFLRIITLLLAISTILWWPLDLFIFRQSSISFRAFLAWRVGFVLIATSSYLLVTHNSWFRKHLFLVCLVMIVPGGMVLGYFIPRIELGGVWPYGGLPMPLLSVLYLTTLRRRIILTLLLATSYPVTYFLLHPKGLQYEMIAFFGGLFLLPVLLSVLAGHKFMIMTKQQFLQEDRMQDATAKLAMFNKVLVSRVNDQTRALQEIAQQTERDREALVQALHKSFTITWVSY